MVVVSGLVAYYAPPPHPTPWPNTSGGGDSKYVSGLLKHINDQNEETVNPFPSDENSIRTANIVEMTTLWEIRD